MRVEDCRRWGKYRSLCFDFAQDRTVAALFMREEKERRWSFLK